MQALIASSSMTTGRDHYTTDSSNAGRCKDSPAQEHAETKNDVTTKKKGRTK